MHIFETSQGDFPLELTLYIYISSKVDLILLAENVISLKNFIPRPEKEEKERDRE